jgi:uncharacterized protein (DUF1501 family)
MKKDPQFMTRREFLRTGVIGGALAATVPAFLDQTLLRLEAAETHKATQRLDGKDAPILILLQLAGGNDGLNTLIPLENDHYRRARPRLSTLENTALQLNGEFGLHENLTGLKALYDEGMLAAVNGVGYPNPNRSHFRSTEIWHTGEPGGRKGGKGWIGRYFDNQCQGMPADTGISLTSNAPQAFLGSGTMGITFRNPNQFRFDKDLDMMDGASIGELTGQGQPEPGSALNFLERTDLDARVSSGQIHATLKKVPGIPAFPNSRLGQDLEMVARLIGGGMSTRIYYLSQGGYDTHANQRGSHANLMRQLGDAQLAFWNEMNRQGNTSRVRMLVFSEFGRRVAENGSGGTDHGAAAPVFVLGGGIRGGIHGALPSLDPGHLHRGDLVHSTDFRSVYASLLHGHLQADVSGVLGQQWPMLEL